MIITNIPNKIKLNQHSYNRIVNNIDFHSITCHHCSHNDWSFHSSYLRYVDFLSRRFKIRISRVICNHCNITHAILIQDMIPFSCLSFSDIVTTISSQYSAYTSPSHFHLLKAKYSPPIPLHYYSLCLFNSRNLPILLVST